MVGGDELTVNVAPGSVVVVRDEEWLVTGVEHSRDGALLSVQGLSELVRDTSATFYEPGRVVTGLRRCGYGVSWVRARIMVVPGPVP